MKEGKERWHDFFSVTVCMISAQEQIRLQINLKILQTLRKFASTKSASARCLDEGWFPVQAELWSKTITLLFWSHLLFINTCLSCGGGSHGTRCCARPLWLAPETLALRSRRARRALEGKELGPKWVTAWDQSLEERLVTQPPGPAREHPWVPAPAGSRGQTQLSLCAYLIPAATPHILPVRFFLSSMRYQQGRMWSCFYT